jgi:pyrimidine-nucleoside phosphorylase
MNIPQLIVKKRRGRELGTDEILAVIDRYTNGTIPDYQMSALLMAVFFRGMTPRELHAWTEAMIGSGDRFDLSGIPGPKVDKHSTGGVGDKVSLSLGPLAAACGVYVPMISGRGLGHTGGTLDKLEAMGMDVRLDKARFLGVLEETGLVFGGQTEDICPADRKLYALRDVTGTVESVPLIASSIMSKKLAEGIGGLVLDIKVGRGAFMKDRKEAALLARTMQRIGGSRGVRVKAVLTDMNQPLGRACGNGIEAVEAIAMLRGEGPEDYREVVLHLVAWMVVLAGRAKTVRAGRAMAEDRVRSGEALDRLRRVVAAQGGDPTLVDHTDRLPLGEHRRDIKAGGNGWVRSLDALKIGLACVALGAGREKAEDAVDFGAGIFLHRKEGERVRKGEALATLYTSRPEKLDEASSLALEAYTLSSREVRKRGKIILGEI